MAMCSREVLLPSGCNVVATWAMLPGDTAEFPAYMSALFLVLVCVEEYDGHVAGDAAT